MKKIYPEDFEVFKITFQKFAKNDKEVIYTTFVNNVDVGQISVINTESELLDDVEFNVCLTMSMVTDGVETLMDIIRLLVMMRDRSDLVSDYDLS